jgi:hypothetical protein
MRYLLQLRYSDSAFFALMVLRERKMCCSCSVGAGRLDYLFELIEPWCYSRSELIEPNRKAKNMPGGRPRKYFDKAAAKAADRLRVAERKAAATKALREGHAVGGKTDGGSVGGYRFILEDSVCLRAEVIHIFHVS